MQHCHQLLSILHNYFDGPTKLFLDPYVAKFLDTSAKPCNNSIIIVQELTIVTLIDNIIRFISSRFPQKWTNVSLVNTCNFYLNNP